VRTGAGATSYGSPGQRQPIHMGTCCCGSLGRRGACTCPIAARRRPCKDTLAAGNVFISTTLGRSKGFIDGGLCAPGRLHPRTHGLLAHVPTGEGEDGFPF